MRKKLKDFMGDMNYSQGVKFYKIGDDNYPFEWFEPLKKDGDRWVGHSDTGAQYVHENMTCEICAGRD